MSWLSDDALLRLRSAASAPDLSSTKYRLIEEIGRGGICTVFLAEDPALGRRVALKVLDVPDPGGELAVRLTREAMILARLEHPGIAPVHDVGRLPDGRVFYAMKFVEGPRLDAFAAAKPTLHERLRVFQRIVQAVAFAHDRGVLHRDLKPENVMVGPFGEVLVMDWGVAKLVGDVSSLGSLEGGGEMADLAVEAGAPTTGHGVVLGTPGYMAPEQATGDPALVDTRADVYALGVILRDLSHGAIADPGPKSRRATPARPLEAIIQRAMAAEPRERYQDVMALARDVAAFRAGEPVSAYHENLFERARRFTVRYSTPILLVLAYLVMRITLLAVRGL